MKGTIKIAVRAVILVEKTRSKGSQDEVWHTKEISKPAVQFEIYDTGIGISKENKKKLFGKFAKIDSDHLNTEGVGLGLYISKIFTQEFGGVIHVESTKDEYTKFLVTLPMLKVDQKEQEPDNLLIGSENNLIKEQDG